MDFDAIQGFFDWLSSELLVGDLSWLSNVYLYPYSMFIAGEIRVDYTPDDTKDYILERRKDVAAAGAVAIRAKVLEIGEKRNSRFPVQVNYVFLNAAKEPIAVNTSRYLCLIDEQDRIRIESVDLTRISIPFRNAPEAASTRTQH